LALSALWVRLRSKAIGPAVAVHAGYNALLALAVVHRTASYANVVLRNHL